MFCSYGCRISFSSEGHSEKVRTRFMIRSYDVHDVIKEVHMRGDEGSMGDGKDWKDAEVRKNHEVSKDHEIRTSCEGQMQQQWQPKE